MSALAATTAQPKPSRRRRAADIASATLRGSLFGAAVAAVAWIAAVVLSGTAFLVLVVATVVVAAITALGGRRVPLGLWGALAAAWAVVLIERAIVNAHGGVWVGAAAWIGAVMAARGAGMPKWAQPLLGYPLISAAIAIAAGTSLLDPWGISWLWVAAVVGPVLGVVVLLEPKKS
jgi:hypothetical protein